MCYTLSAMNEGLFEKYLASGKEERASILSSLAREKTEDVASILKTLYEHEDDKELLKTIRRLIFHLRTRGLKVEEQKKKGSPVLRRVIKERFAKGYVSSYDKELNRIVLLVNELKKDILLVTHAITNLRKGIEELKSGEANVSDYFSWLERQKKALLQDDIFIAEISAHYALYLMEEASRNSKGFREDIEFLKGLLSKSPASKEIRDPSQIYELYKDIGESISVSTLMNHKIFSNLFLLWEGMEKDRAEYEKIGEAPIVLPQYLKEQKKKEYVRELVEKERLSQIKRDIKRVLEDYAYILNSEGDHPYARAIIAALNNQNTFEEILFHFLEKSLSETFYEEHETDKLIVSPHEYLRSVYEQIPS